MLFLLADDLEISCFELCKLLTTIQVAGGKAKVILSCPFLFAATVQRRSTVVLLLRDMSFV